MPENCFHKHRVPCPPGRSASLVFYDNLSMATNTERLHKHQTFSARQVDKVRIDEPFRNHAAGYCELVFMKKKFRLHLRKCKDDALSYSHPQSSVLLSQRRIYYFAKLKSLFNFAKLQRWPSNFIPTYWKAITLLAIQSENSSRVEFLRILEFPRVSNQFL